MSTRVGIIDLGTNTFHILIAELEGTQFSFVYKEKIHVALGKGGINLGEITPDAGSRAISAAEHIRTVIDRYNVQTVKCVATSAFRNSANATQLITRVSKITGAEIAVISGDQEAEYIFEGISFGLKLNEADALIMDIGGGSIEFIIGSSLGIKWKKSLEIGAQRLTDEFQKNDPIIETEIANLSQFLVEKLLPVRMALQRFEPRILIGSSGTFDTFSEIYRRKNNINIIANLTELPLTLQAVGLIHSEIISKNRAERLLIPGMIEMRVDLIVVASILIQVVLSMNSFDEIRVSSYSLKEGIFSQYLKTQKFLV